MKKRLTLTTALLLTTHQAQAAETIKTVFVIALENHNWTQPASLSDPEPIFQNPAAPYINSLVAAGNPNAAQSSWASNYLQVPAQSAASPSGAGPVHPSEPNYIWAEAGVAGPRNDADPYPSNIVTAPSLSATLASSGQSWRSYQEGIDLVPNGGGQPTNAVLPTSQYIVPLKSFSGTSVDYTNEYNGSHQYNYAAKHNPQVFFTATNGGNDPSASNSQAHNYAPLEQLKQDLTNNTVAKYNWITPDQYNDMHTALTNGFDYNGIHYTGDDAKIAQGDNFLSKIIPLIMASDAYKNDGAIVIWDDEAEDEDGTNAFTIPEIVLSPLAKGGAYNSSIAYDHSSDLRTMQEIFGLTPEKGYSWLGGAANATDLADLFKPAAIPGVPEPASWAMMLAGFGIVGSAIRRRPARYQTA
jgi:hypothetical protein